MSFPERRKRPELDRSAPIRRFDGLFGQTSPGMPDSAKSTSRVGPEPRTGAASRGVDVGYQVIEEYMRQGQAFARAAWAPYVPKGVSAAPDARRLAERVYQYASDLAAVWLEYVQVAASQVPVAGAVRRSPPQDERVGDARVPDPVRSGDAGRPNSVVGKPEDASQDAHGATQISVEIASSQRAAVTVDLKPGSARLPLSVHALRAKDEALPRISGVAIHADASENRVLVRIDVPAGQPVATYSGLIVDDTTNVPRGTLTLRLQDEHQG